MALQVQTLQKKLGKGVILVAVTKGVAPDQIEKAFLAGIVEIGENRVQEAEKKFTLLNHSMKKHYLGKVQSNKIKKIVKLFDCVQSLDSLKTAQLLDFEAANQGKKLEVMIQINIGNEVQKQGILPESIAEFYDHLLDCKHLKIAGIMCIAPALDPSKASEREELIEYFKKMKSLQLDMELEHCSMGMSADYKFAVAAGSTMVRLGRAIFGERS